MSFQLWTLPKHSLKQCKATVAAVKSHRRSTPKKKTWSFQESFNRALEKKWKKYRNKNSDQKSTILTIGGIDGFCQYRFYLVWINSYSHLPENVFFSSPWKKKHLGTQSCPLGFMSYLPTYRRLWINQGKNLWCDDLVYWCILAVSVSHTYPNLPMPDFLKWLRKTNNLEYPPA